VRLFQLDGSALVPLGPVLLGHRDWIRGLAISPCDGARRSTAPAEHSTNFLLATSSADATARVWRFQLHTGAAGADDDDEFGVIGEETRARTHVKIGPDRWTIALEALLDEHTAAVHSVAFAHDTARPVLLTSSMDGSVALWSSSRGVRDEDVRWQATARFGLLGGAGAHLVGFSGAAFVTPGADRVVAHTLGGGLHSWRRTSVMAATAVSPEDDETHARFLAESAPGGHVAPVNAVVWDPAGRFLMSCSDDKTTRVYVEAPDADSAEAATLIEWSRPQVHGHSIRDVAFLVDNGSSFASASEEKVLRVFDAPSQFVLPGNLRMLHALNAANGEREPAATCAAVPELGLSNKPVYLREIGEGKVTQVKASKQAGADLDEETVMTWFGAERAANSAPLEVELRQHRLWPERAKLYGHGNELSCIAVARSLGILASASRAQAPRDAAIFLWDVVSGEELQQLLLHDLTVNQLRFSQDGESLLSVSRDRSFAVFRCSGNRKFELTGRRMEAHGRLLHTGCWLLGGRLIATGARDKFLKIFDASAADFPELFKRKYAAGVSALDVAEAGDILGVGLEDGSVLVERVELSESSPPVVQLQSIASLSPQSKCSARVTRLAWRPCMSDSMLQLAVASEDHAVRVYSFEARS
jgi:elongator complex protein 2